MPTPANMNDLDRLGLATALAKARKSYQEGGIPIGAALVYHGTDAAAVLGCAHNQRIQKSSPTLHAEIAALEDAGRQRAAVYRNSTMVRRLQAHSCHGTLTRTTVMGGLHTVYDVEVRVHHEPRRHAC